jgi:hypothetical protein
MHEDFGDEPGVEERTSDRITFWNEKIYQLELQKQEAAENLEAIERQLRESQAELDAITERKLGR